MSKHKTTLVQAIRRGAQLGEQCQGTYFYRGGSCALGAAYLEVCGSKGRGDEVDQALGEHFPELLRYIEHPVEGYHMTLMSSIVSLNDEYRWTREQIADWIETLQPEEE